MATEPLSVDGDTTRAERAGTRLTERQREVLARVRRGLSNKEIAAELGITEEGVKAHLARLYLRFGVRNRVQLLAEAGGLLDGETGSNAPLASLRIMARAARAQMNTFQAHAGPDQRASIDARLETLRRALESLDVALEVVATLPPTAAGKALRIVRKRMSSARVALRELETAVT
ncbi:MAG TPA: helix-turn-helix transcriptional regulator [Candidatus Limnocylindria bacterium]|nr:helix-turn-helix transcriptional regulator [Candidatus Limnocylindria bacterium]